MKKLLFVSVILLGVLVAPGLGVAETTAEIIARLLAQIQVLQEQLLRLQAQQNSGWCFVFNKNLGVGVSGPDVVSLRNALTIEGFNIPKISAGMAESEVFTESFAAVVSAFQLKYRSEILTPNGLSAPTGYVGVATRAKLNALYGCWPPVGNQPPVISGVSGPTALAVGQTGTWTVQASDPENGPLNYSVIWGNEIDFGGLPMAGSPSIPMVQTSTFAHSYAMAGTYNVRFTVTDSAGQSAQSSISVNVTQTGPDITVLAPNGGEQWGAYTTQMIRWGYRNLSSTNKVDIYLEGKLPPCAYSNPACLIASRSYDLDKNIAINGGYNWIVATDIINNPIPAGEYYMKICLAGTTNCDQSDRPFTITLATY